MKEYITACPRNCYSTCSFRVQTDNNRIIKILPYSSNRATPEGPCIKGLSYIERANSPSRIIKPLLKTRNDTFEEISFTRAFGIIAERLTAIREKYGSQSILWYKGSGMSGLTNEIGYEFWKAFGGTSLTYGNLCWPAGLEAVRLTLGSSQHNAPWDLVNARTIILWGKNPAETNIHETAFIAEARKKGCRVIVIDPFRTPSADKAEMLISPKPGTDAALALAIAYELIRGERINRKFIEEHVRGFKEFSDSLYITPAKASEITGIPEKDILELADIIANGSPLTIIAGYGLQRHRNGGQTIRAILSLTALTGNIGSSGAGFNYADLRSYIYDTVKEPVSYYPYIEKDLPFRRNISMARLGKDILEARSPEIKAIWVERGNPLRQNPGTGEIKSAFAKADFIVAVDQFMTETCQAADLILPAKNMFEQIDIIGSYWSPYIQLKPKVIDPPDGVLPESEIYYHLAQAMHFEITEDKIPAPGENNIEKWLENRIKGYSKITLADLRNGPVLPPGYTEIAWEKLKFHTKSGKIELLSDEAEEKWGISQLPEYVPVNNIGDNANFPLNLLTPNSGYRIHSQFGNLNIIKEFSNDNLLRISPADADSRKLRDGALVRVFNSAGQIFCRISITNRAPEGVIVLPNGIPEDEGGGSNNLIEGVHTDIGYGSAFHDNYVEVEAAEE